MEFSGGPMADKIAWQTVLARVKKVLAGFKTGKTSRDIMVEQTLSGRWPTGLGFDDDGLRSLTKELNKEFEEYDWTLKLSIVRASENVLALYSAIWELIPARLRDE